MFIDTPGLLRSIKGKDNKLPLWSLKSIFGCHYKHSILSLKIATPKPFETFEVFIIGLRNCHPPFTFKYGKRTMLGLSFVQNSRHPEDGKYGKGERFDLIHEKMKSHHDVSCAQSFTGYLYKPQTPFGSI